MNIRTSLQSAQGESPLNDTELYAKMKDCWIKKGSAFFTAEDIAKMDTYHAMAIEAAAIMKYGRRNKGE